MKCTIIRSQLDEYLDDTLSELEHAAVSEHLAQCAACRAEADQRRSLLDGLRTLSVPPMRNGFRERAFRQAGSSRRGVRRYTMALAGAVAAGLVAVAVVLLQQPDSVEQPGSGLQVVQLQVETPSRVSLVFNASERMSNVEFRLELPKGVSLAGYPGQRELAWQDRLQPGRNVLKLELIARSGAAGDLISTLYHEGRQREFRITLKATDADAALKSVRQANVLI